jgi:hypothetical protein
MVDHTPILYYLSLIEMLDKTKVRFTLRAGLHYGGEVHRS